MVRLEAAHARDAEILGCAGSQLDEAQRVREVVRLERMPERLRRVTHARFDAARAGDHERPAALVLIKRRQQEQRNAAEVIRVEVRDRDRIDLVARDAERRQPRERRLPAVHQQRARRAAY